MSLKTSPALEQHLRQIAPTEKRCRKCGKTKPQKDFAISTICADGLDTYCRSCRREMWMKRNGGLPHLLARFTTEELESEITRRKAEEA